MKTPKPFPATTLELLRELEEIYPLRKPAIDDPLHVIQRQAGQQDVIDYIRMCLARATNSHPDKKLLGG